MSFKVLVTNNKGNTFSGIFKTKDEAKLWIKKIQDKPNNPWGKKERIVTLDYIPKNSKVLDIKKTVHTIKNKNNEYIEVIEKYYVIKLPQDYTVEIIPYIDFDKLRSIRNKYLKQTDFLMLSDVEIDTRHRSIYKEYRKYLRDLPKKQVDIVLEFKDWLIKYKPEEFKDGGKSNFLIKYIEE